MEHAALLGRVVLDRGLVEVAFRRAGLGGEAGAAAAEVEDDLLRGCLADPEVELRAVGALAVAARDDPLPPLIAGRGRGGRRRGRDRAHIIVAAAARRDRGRQRGKNDQQRPEPSCVRAE
jgi:hypothetical protein